MQNRRSALSLRKSLFLPYNKTAFLQHHIFILHYVAPIVNIQKRKKCDFGDYRAYNRSFAQLSDYNIR